MFPPQGLCTRCSFYLDWSPSRILIFAGLTSVFQNSVQISSLERLSLVTLSYAVPPFQHIWILYLVLNTKEENFFYFVTVFPQHWNINLPMRAKALSWAVFPVSRTLPTHRLRPGESINICWLNVVLIRKVKALYWGECYFMSELVCSQKKIWTNNNNPLTFMEEFSYIRHMLETISMTWICSCG